MAAKTMFRDAAGAATDLAISLAALRTDHLDLYQMHSVPTKEDVDQILAPGGCLELFKQKKAEGVIKPIGFSAHDEEQVRVCACGAWARAARRVISDCHPSECMRGVRKQIEPMPAMTDAPSLR